VAERRHGPESGIAITLVPGALPSRCRLRTHRLRRIATRAAVENGLAETRVHIILTGDVDLRRLNREYRGKDAPTDVLSFDLRDETRETSEGEIYISLPYAHRRAALRRRSLEGEVIHLAVHGLLHLAGHDHGSNEDWQEMERLARRYL
jgi:probable rRNA maturation factor